VRGLLQGAEPGGSLGDLCRTRLALRPRAGEVRRPPELVLEFDSYFHRNAKECPVVSYEEGARVHHSYAAMAPTCMHLWLLCTLYSKCKLRA
jgi:hypothetical protein